MNCGACLDRSHAAPRRLPRRYSLTLEVVRALCAVILLVLTTATDAPAQNIRAITAAREAWASIRDGRNQAAARAFEDAIRDMPREPSLHFGLGLASHLMGQTSRARTELAESLRLTPDFTDASLLLGEILYRAGTVDEAIQVYKAAQVHMLIPFDDFLASLQARETRS